MVRLHIVIPTYNRALKLASVLKSISRFAEQHFISVFDNCSTDGTQSLCEGYANSNENIKYVRRCANIGGNGNILLAALHGLGEGDLLWILPDDDEIDEIALDQLAYFIASLNCAKLPDAIVVGACSSRAQNTNWPLSGPRDIKNGISEFWMHASFLPSLILNSKNVKKGITADLFYVGGCYSQMLLLRHLLYDNVNIVTAPSRVIYRGEDDVMPASIAWWMISWLKATQYFPELYKNGMCKTLLGNFLTLPLRYTKALAFNPAEENSTMNVNYYDLISLFKGSRRYYVIMFWPAALIPASLLRFVWRLYRGKNITAKTQSLART